MSKKAATQNVEVKEEVVETAVEEIPAVDEKIPAEPAKKENFFKRHWKKLLGGVGAAGAIGAIAFLATRKLHGDDEDDSDYVQALQDYVDAAKETAVEVMTDSASTESTGDPSAE